MEQKSSLFTLTCMEVPDEMESELLGDRDFFLQNIQGLSERETMDMLNKLVSHNADHHKKVCVALLYVMLTDRPQAPKAWHDLLVVTRDELRTVLHHITMIVSARFDKLLMPVKLQFIWILEQLAINNIAGADQFYILLLSCIKGGDVSTPNILFTEQMIKTVRSQILWLPTQPFVLTTTVYTFLRLIVDHTSNQVAHVRQAEIAMCIKLIRENFLECVNIGRDFVRLLQAVSKIPEFIELWRDILYNPKTLSPEFSGILQILSIRTSKRYLACRLTPDMESKLVFLSTQVKFGQQTKYQLWFCKRYLSSPESQSLVCDFIRYMCAVIHPTNEMLNSNIVPRWVIIGWLLTKCTSNVMAAQAKLALFYDWLFYDKEKENIMNIEPGILVMHHCLKNHPTIAATLMDFLCRMTTEFCPALQAEVWEGIKNAFNDILEKQVIPDINLLINHPRLDEELRIMFGKKFPDICPNRKALQIDMEEGGEDDSKFSDEEKELPPPPPPPPPALNFAKVEPSEELEELNEISPTCSEDESLVVEEHSAENSSMEEKEESSNISMLLTDLDSDILEPVTKFVNEAHPMSQRTALAFVISTLLEHPTWTRTKLAVIAKCLHPSLNAYFGLSVMEEEEEVPLHHLIFQHLSLLTRDKRPRVWKFLTELYQIEPRIGYHLLFYLHRRAQLDLYTEFASFTTVGNLKACLTDDLRLCQDEDSFKAFFHIVPDLYQKFPTVTTGNIEILHLLVSCIDAHQLHTIICVVMSKKMKIFNHRVRPMLRATLEWETFEQYCVWQLISAESVPSETVIDVLKDLKDCNPYEMLSSMLIFLKSIKPSEKIVKKIIFLQNFEETLVIPIVLWWIDKYEDGMIRIIEGFVVSAVSGMDDKRLNIIVGLIEKICNTIDSSHIIYEATALWTQIRTSYSFLSPLVKKECVNIQRLINESRYNKSDDDEPQLKKKRKEVSIFDSDDD